MRRSRLRSANEGRSLVGLLVVLAVLGISAGIAVTTTGGGTSIPTLPPETGSSTTGTHGSQTPVAAGASEVCRTDYEAVSEAVAAFAATDGHNPTSIDQLAGWLKDPVTSPYFTITLDSSGSGAVDVATPGHPGSPGTANCAYAGASSG